MNSYPNLHKLIETVARLRGPDGCPWDKEQDHKTLKKYLLNESYELFDAIDSGNKEHISEELGDVLLQVILHSQIASENNSFNIDDVAKKINEKIISRHPHVFGDVKVKDSNEVLYNWEQIKNIEKPERKSVLDGIPKSTPSLLRAEMISKKAISVGFEWPTEDMLWDTFYSEIEEFKTALSSKDPEKSTEEMGDILFSLVNIARWHKIIPEFALQNSNDKFIERFKLMERISEKQLSECTQEELEKLWQKSKTILIKGKDNDK